MQFPKTYLSLHEITGLRAAAGISPEKPLTLTIEGPHGAMQITLYLQPLLTGDQIEFLADMINATITPEPPAAACPAEKAAYKSADDYWASLKRDLDARPIDRMVSELGKLQAGAPSPVDGKR